MPVAPQEWLNDQYLKRRKKNQNYSIRAFARMAGISSGRMSQLLSAKRMLTLSMANRIATALEVDPSERAAVLSGVAELRRKVRTMKTLSPRTAEKLGAALYELKKDEFEFVADPLHFSVLSLIDTNEFVSDVAWMARRLGRSVVEVKKILTRLEKIGLVKFEQKKYVLCKGGVRTSTDIPFLHLRKAQQTILREAGNALNEIPVLLRDITSITVALDRDALPQAKELIANFRRNLANLLESGQRNEVYRLAIQFYPVTKVQEQSKRRIKDEMRS